AGGGALLLLEKSAIPEGRGYGGFPVSGIWLRCDDADINKRHHAKVYGKASVGSPPMSVPHLDTRVIGGKHSLLFGPYCGFFHQVPQVRLAHGPVRVDPASQYPAAAGGCSRQLRSDQISHRPGSADGASPLRRPARILSARQAG